jgi:hypothetical protein
MSPPPFFCSFSVLLRGRELSRGRGQGGRELASWFFDRFEEYFLEPKASRWDSWRADLKRKRAEEPAGRKPS